MEKKLKVIELFAGVGGFRIGLENYPRDKNSSFEVIWSNQWEPSTKKQPASSVYETRWPNSNHSNCDIEEVISERFEEIPKHDLLVGGFPCQDYSVASSLRNSKGLRGRKGVLWWSIEAILRRKGVDAPGYLLLENVDRLLKSPANQRGRDFAIMLRSLSSLGYAVEWKVINAAEYGMPQRRKRVFILAYHQSTGLYKQQAKEDPKRVILNNGVLATAFSSSPAGEMNSGELVSDLVALSKCFNEEGGASPFESAGYMLGDRFYSLKVVANSKEPLFQLKDVLVPKSKVPEAFLIPKEQVALWEYQKGAKHLKRVSRSGHPYIFSEGKMVFPDALDKPSRTIITGEGGPTPSRFKHVVKQGARLRRLLPIELERLNMFPDNHTEIQGVSNSKRAFFMGNALVTGVVSRIGKALIDAIDQSE